MDFSQELNPLRLPDCRAREDGTVVRARMLWEKVYCANCGHLGGLITADWAAHVFYLCDPCSHEYGELNLPQVPEKDVQRV